MKRYKFICYLLIIFAFLLSVSTAEASQNFEFYYQTVEKVERNTGLGKVAGVWNSITGTDYTKTGSQKWYSKTDNNLIYTVNRIKINSRQELIEAMGAKTEDELKPQQKAILASYDYTKSEALQERTQYAYKDPCTILYTDTSTTDWSYTDKNGETKTVSDGVHKSDFWSWSNSGKNVISMSTESMANTANVNYLVETTKSTMLHEYCHSIDKTNKENSNPYGKDGTHYGNELTKSKAAFVEGWAEYNEMIEFPSQANSYKNNKSPIVQELTAKNAKKLNLDPALEVSSPFSIKSPGQWAKASVGDSIYIYRDPEEMTAEEIWKCESYNCNALYELATNLENGKQKIYDAFLATRGKSGRDIRTFVKKLCEQNPSDIAQIGGILDKLTYNKMTDKEFEKFIGTSSEAKSFLASRTSKPANNDAGSTTIGEKISNAASTIRTGIASTTQKIGETGSKIGSTIKAGVASATKKIGDTGSKIGSKISDIAHSIGEKFSNTKQTVSNKVASTTTKIGNGVASASQKIGEAVKSVGNAISNFIEKVKEVAKKVVEVVKDTVSKVVDFFKNLFGKKSNSEEATTTEEEVIEEETTETTTEVENIEGEENEEQEEVIETVDTVTTSDENTSELIGTSDQEGDIFNIR